MNRLRSLILANVLLIAAPWTATASGPDEAGPARLPRENLLIRRAEDGSPAPVRSVEDWQARRAEIVRGVESVMGRLPGDSKRSPLDVTTLEEADCGSYVRRKISYQSEPGSRVPAYLLIPKTALQNPDARIPAILCLHGTDNVTGAGTVVGIGGKPNRQYASELAERGYVTLAPNYPLLAEYQPDLAKLGWESGSLKAVWDNMRGVDLLASLPFVRPDAIGAIGHSLGGHNAVYTAVFDDRIKAVVSSCGLDSFLDYKQGDEANWRPEKGWCQTRYMPRLADYRGRLAEIPFDFHELVAALAPRRTLIVAPLGDSNFDWRSVDRIAAAARPVFALYGEPDHLNVEHPDCPHDFPEPMRQAAYRLFDEAFGAPAKP
jgi:acetyl esterase/lipase